MTPRRSAAGRWIVAVAGTLACGAALTVTSGLPFTVLLFATVVGVLDLARRVAGRTAGRRVAPALLNCTVVAGSLLFCLVIAEAVILVIESTKVAAARSETISNLVEDGNYPTLPDAVYERARDRFKPVSMPDEWARRRTDVPGAWKAYYWHDVLHVVDTNRFRRTTPFPDKRADTFRIMVLGDSLTYGEGIEAEWAYPEQLERELGRTYRVEVLNLGVPGYQSEDILDVLRTFYDPLQPDLVLYGICHNDFLDSMQMQYAGDIVDLPDFLTSRSKALSSMQDMVNKAGRALGLSQDFFDDILDGLRSYRVRFAKDLEAMNRHVTERGGDPIVAMVLDQFPNLEGRQRQLTAIAEEAARNAGMEVIPTDAYYASYGGRVLYVSPWEGHPNEVANAIFAGMIADAVAGCCGMADYARDRVTGPAGDSNE